MEYIEFVLIVVLCISIHFITYKYLVDKTHNEKKIKNDYTSDKSLKMYIISLVIYVLLIMLSYFINLFALDRTDEVLIVIFILFSYMLATIESFVHSNMAVEYMKYLIRSKDEYRKKLILIINLVFTLIITCFSIISFIPLTDYIITKIFRIIMLSSFILSFALVNIYKELKPYIFKKKER